LHYQIEIKEATQLLKTHFGIQGKLTALPGEIDLNFKVDTVQGASFVLKIAPPQVPLSYLDFQQKLLAHLKQYNAPKLIKDKKGRALVAFQDKNGIQYRMRLLTWISGRVWRSVNPHTDALRFDLGENCGALCKQLETFDHPYAHRNFDWDIAQSIWVEDHLDLFDNDQKRIIKSNINAFKDFQPNYQNLRKSVIHNDANDNNIIVSEELKFPQVRSLIDYGDAIYTQTINDVAICCAYAIMDIPDPLEAALPIVRGYHKSFPLQEQELEFLYSLIAVRLIISVTKAAINKIETPANEYLWISEKPAWELLYKWSNISPEFAHYQFRKACNLEPHPSESRFTKWAKDQKISISTLFPTLKKSKIYPLDLSVSSTWVGREEEFNDLDFFQFKIDQIQKRHPKKLIAGGYLEPRPLYTSETYNKIGNSGPEQRCIHLGVDFWIAAQTPVHAIFDGTVVMAINDEGEKAYGGMIILKHDFKEFSFYTLYGHLSLASLEHVQLGDQISKGSCFAWTGDFFENGNWAPHLHFQVLLSLLDFKNDFPGVCFYSQINTWKSICPDPNMLFKSTVLDSVEKDNTATILEDRKVHLGKGMSLQYQEPLHMVRGAGAYLIDNHGRRYLDMVNNVAHVGHEHPKVVQAGQLQMGQLNTNSRYLHENITRLAKRLIATLPQELSVIHFVNSGSEANELALRMIKTVTGSKQILASQTGYHGNTNSCIDVSSYKFDGKGGNGKPEHTHIFPIPDSFRGKYRGKDTTANYLLEVEKLITALQQQNKSLGGMIIEPIISCGGQIELPPGFLKGAFQAVRKAGGLCVVDEVQTGCGRVGSHFWGFNLHDVIPDIVTIGKPLGNGHPIAAVACTLTIAEQFNNGMEFFNTFGGNPVSCAIANAVLEVVSEEKLQENAYKVGNYLKAGLHELATQYPIMGSIRGQGLFLGIEFADHQCRPLAKQADYVINRMKSQGILLSTDGPDHNVIKIKPPLVFSIQNAALFLASLKQILKEDFMQFE